MVRLMSYEYHNLSPVSSVHNSLYRSQFHTIKHNSNDKNLNVCILRLCMGARVKKTIIYEYLQGHVYFDI